MCVVEACVLARTHVHTYTTAPPSSLTRTGGGRKWEYLKPNKNGNVPALKLHVKKGDFVQVCLCVAAHSHY